MANKWLTHVKKTMKTMKSKGTYKKGDGLKKVIMEAKKSWHHKKGGEEPEETASAPATAPATVEAPATAGRRRKTRKHRRSGGRK